MDYNDFTTKILEIDPKIRFAVVYDAWSRHVSGGLRKGVESLLSAHAEKELVNLSIINWQARKSMAKYLGKTIYTLDEHDKIKRFSFYLGEDHLLLVSTEKDADTKFIVDEIIKLYHQIQN